MNFKRKYETPLLRCLAPADAIAKLEVAAQKGDVSARSALAVVARLDVSARDVHVVPASERQGGVRQAS